MTTNRSLSLVNTLVLLGAALCSSASLASAQSAIKGEFTLPTEVRWGQAVLPAGQYSFDLQSIRAPEVIHVRGEGKNVLVMASGESALPSTTDSALVLAQNGATNVVRSLRLAPLGMTLHYTPHKGEVQSVAMATGSTQRIPVRVSGR